MNEPRFIVGAGMTGLAAGLATGYPVYEAAAAPGGICASYYVRPGTTARLTAPPADGEAYRFEHGGGHWIFGGDPEILTLVERFAPLRRYTRRSSVYLPEHHLFIPYPIQYHLHALPPALANAALRELEMAPGPTTPATMAEWVERFGPTLNRLFFAPFQDAYTAGLWTHIAPQDGYKTPIDRALVRLGAEGNVPAAGYNTEFVYPIDGLDRLAGSLATEVGVHYGRRLVGVDTDTRRARFADGTERSYERLLATVPLNELAEMAGIDVGEPADPYTSVLVLNLGARRGPQTPADHWVYIPGSASGFHRVGFYDNVDAHFLPASVRDRRTHASLYVERAFQSTQRPGAAGLAAYTRSAIEELQAWGFIGAVDAVDATWIEVAYTWRRPGSTWRERTLRALARQGIQMIGRYARWEFQGIAASIREGWALRSGVRA
jgi:protoporphyrinogen oxidase